MVGKAGVSVVRAGERMSDTTGYEDFLAGRYFNPGDSRLRELRGRCYALLDALNVTSNADKAARADLLRELLGACGEGVNVKSPFQCDYGVNLRLGAGVFVGVGCVFLDVAPIEIGDGTLVGPQVGIYAVEHPIDAAERALGVERGRAVRIGRNCWIGGHATINPGVKLGDNVIVASGAVVTRSFPDNVMVAGVPARVVREL